MEWCKTNQVNSLNIKQSVNIHWQTVSSHTFIPIIYWKKKVIYNIETKMSYSSHLHLFLLNKCLWAGWPRRWHLHDSLSREQWGLSAKNRTPICHCTLIKFIQRHCTALEMDGKSINQSQMDYVLYGLCPIAYSKRYRGLKGHGGWVHTHALVCVTSQWVMMTTGSTYWSGKLMEGVKDKQQHSFPSMAEAEKVQAQLGECRKV